MPASASAPSAHFSVARALSTSVSERAAKIVRFSLGTWATNTRTCEPSIVRSAKNGSRRPSATARSSSSLASGGGTPASLVPRKACTNVGCSPVSSIS